MSWRVHILPYIGHQSLYKKFRLEEPWDSPHNRQLLDAMPDCFRNVTSSPNSHMTSILTFTGPGTPFEELGLAPQMRSIRDGASTTVCFMRAPDEFAVPWTKPSDFPVDCSDPDEVSAFEKLRTGTGLTVAMFDGSVQHLTPDFRPEDLRAIVTPTGGELFKRQDLFK